MPILVSSVVRIRVVPGPATGTPAGSRAITGTIPGTLRGAGAVLHAVTFALALPLPLAGAAAVTLAGTGTAALALPLASAPTTATAAGQKHIHVTMLEDQRQCWMRFGFGGKTSHWFQHRSGISC